MHRCGNRDKGEQSLDFQRSESSRGHTGRSLRVGGLQDNSITVFSQTKKTVLPSLVLKGEVHTKFNILFFIFTICPLKGMIMFYGTQKEVYDWSFHTIEVNVDWSCTGKTVK